MNTPFAKFSPPALSLSTSIAIADLSAFQFNEVFEYGITRGIRHYKGMEFGYQTELFAYQACGKAFTRLHGKENTIQGCMFEFKLRQGHLEIEEASKAAGYCGACTPVNVYRVKDSGVIYLRTTVLPSAPQCKEVKGTCW